MQLTMRSQRVRQGLTVIHWILAMIPLLFGIGLVGMTAHAARLIRKFPQPSIDDPYLFGQTDAMYQFWINWAQWFFSFTILSVIPWCCLTALTVLLHWRYWSKTETRRSSIWQFLPIAIYFLAIVILWVEPSDRIGWLLD